MVNSISGSGGAPGIKRTADDVAARIKAVKTGASAPSGSPVQTGDTMQISTAAAALPQELKSPPIEMEAVKKIQEAIANGNYPIDLDAITESLFESYLELNS